MVEHEMWEHSPGSSHPACSYFWPSASNPRCACRRPAGNRNRKLAAVEPRAGLALLHKHGEHCLDHEAAEVKSGVKYVLRSDVVFQRRR